MKIQDLMTADVRTCRPTDTLGHAAQVMWENDVGCLPVVDQDARLVGVITDRDLAMAAHFRGAPLWAIQVGDAMAKVVYSCAPGDKLRQAARLMSDHQLRRLPVTDRESRLVGMVSLTSFAQAAAGKGKRKSSLSGRDVCDLLAAITSPRLPQLNETVVVEVTRETPAVATRTDLIQPALPKTPKSKKQPPKKRKLAKSPR